VNSVELEIPKRLRQVFGDIEGVLSGAMSLEEAMEATETKAQRVRGTI